MFLMKSFFNDFDTCVYDKKMIRMASGHAVASQKKDTRSRIYLHIYSYNADIGVLFKVPWSF